MKYTNDNIFIDTNLLVYLYSNTDHYKRGAVECLFDDHFNSLIISTQVINEFICVMFRKKIAIMSNLVQLIHEFAKFFNIKSISMGTIDYALRIKEKYGYDYFDSLMIASAIEHECKVMFSEDMQDGQIIENQLIIINPFPKQKIEIFPATLLQV